MGLNKFNIAAQNDRPPTIVTIFFPFFQRLDHLHRNKHVAAKQKLQNSARRRALEGFPLLFLLTVFTPSIVKNSKARYQESAIGKLAPLLTLPFHQLNNTANKPPPLLDEPTSATP